MRIPKKHTRVVSLGSKLSAPWLKGGGVTQTTKNLEMIIVRRRIKELLVRRYISNRHKGHMIDQVSDTLYNITLKHIRQIELKR
jgi:hypothetical protein